MEGKRVSIYSTGAEAYRDTTKWLVAFVPVATLVAAAVALGPRLLQDAAAAPGLAEWVQGSGLALVGLALIGGGVAAVMIVGAKLLSTQPVNFAELMNDSTKLSQAFTAGVAAPYFLDDVAFARALADLAVTTPDDTATTPEDAARDAKLQGTAGVTDTLRDWALQQELSAAFSRFAWAFAAAVVLITGGFLITAGALGPAPPRFDEPSMMQVYLDQAGTAELREGTGCTDPERSAFYAVGGTWEAPVLEVDGPDCRFGARWEPTERIELRPVPSK